PTGALGRSITADYSLQTTLMTAVPTSAQLRFNAATENTATATYVNHLDTGATDWTAVLDTFDASSSTVKGQVRLVKTNDATAWMTFDLTSRTTQTGYREFAISNTHVCTPDTSANRMPLLALIEQTG